MSLLLAVLVSVGRAHAVTEDLETVPAAATAMLNSPASAIDHVYPPGTVVNVRSFGATGNGVTDDTRAIQSAISALVGYGPKHILYFPNGTYLISKPLLWQTPTGSWQNYLTLQGESRLGTVLRLADGAAGFGDANSPQAMVVTASLYGASDGSGNNAQHNSIADMSIDVGSDNPGAIGVSYVATNECSIRDVRITSDDGQGAVGLDMTRYGAGPCELEGLEIDGFAIGINVANLEYGLTFDRILVRGQRSAGIVDSDNVLSMEDVVSLNSVPALVITSHYAGSENAMVTLIDAYLLGVSPLTTAIVNGGRLYARNVVTSGYSSAVNGSTSSTLTEWQSDAAQPWSGRALELPIEQPPVFEDYSMSDWVSVDSFGAVAGTDSTAAIQAAIDSGAPVVYLPESYEVTRTIHLRSTTKALIGFETWLTGVGPSFSVAGTPVLSIESPPGHTVFVDRISINPGAGTAVSDSSPAPVVIRDAELDGTVAYTNRGHPGPLFTSDTCGGSYDFAVPQRVWARQIDPEADVTKITNDGGDLWILGLKTEQPTTAILTEGGGSTELLGGLLYPTRPVPASVPALLDDNSNVSAFYSVSAYGSSANDYSTQVAAIGVGETSNLLSSELPGRTLAVAVSPTYVARLAPASSASTTTPLPITPAPVLPFPPLLTPGRPLTKLAPSPPRVPAMPNPQPHRRSANETERSQAAVATMSA